MPTDNPFPLCIVPKVDSPELTAWLAQHGHDKYINSEDINKILVALQYLFENIGSGGGGGSQTYDQVLEINNSTAREAWHEDESYITRLTTTGIVITRKSDNVSIIYQANGFYYQTSPGNYITFYCEVPTSNIDVKLRAISGDLALTHEINQHYKGTHTTLSALQTAHPSAEAGDYAIVDGGASVEAVQYIWDNDGAEWIATTNSAPTTTDALPEGTANLYFTNTRAIDALAGVLALKKNTSVIFCSHNVQTLADNFTYYFGVPTGFPPTIASNPSRRFEAPFTGNITDLYATCISQTVTSAEDVIMKIKNVTQNLEYVVGNVRYNNVVTKFIFNSLNIPVTKNDSLEIQIVVPVLGTNGVGSGNYINVVFEKV